jgi:V-type H+-transporting ATPase subunit a
MTLGVLLKGSNALYFRHWIDFLFEFVPQLLILLAMFGFMDYLIIQKWLTDWQGRETYAPSVISTMIDMFLNGGKPSIQTDAAIMESWEL